MTDAVISLLNSFAQLSPPEQVAFISELKKSHVEIDMSSSDNEEMAYMADQLFLMYDREEEENAST